MVRKTRRQFKAPSEDESMESSLSASATEEEVEVVYLDDEDDEDSPEFLGTYSPPNSSPGNSEQTDHHRNQHQDLNEGGDEFEEFDEDAEEQEPDSEQLTNPEDGDAAHITAEVLVLDDGARQSVYEGADDALDEDVELSEADLGQEDVQHSDQENALPSQEDGYDEPMAEGGEDEGGYESDTEDDEPAQEPSEHEGSPSRAKKLTTESAGGRLRRKFPNLDMAFPRMKKDVVKEFRSMDGLRTVIRYQGESVSEFMQLHTLAAMNKLQQPADKTIAATQQGLISVEAASVALNVFPRQDPAQKPSGNPIPVDLCNKHNVEFDPIVPAHDKRKRQQYFELFEEVEGYEFGAEEQAVAEEEIDVEN